MHQNFKMIINEQIKYRCEHNFLSLEQLLPENFMTFFFSVMTW